MANVKTTRPFPVHEKVVIRSVLFALSKLGTRLNQYNEKEGVIIATKRRSQTNRLGIGWGEHEIRASIVGHDNTAVMVLDAPESMNIELLKLIATYVTHGSKAIKDDAIGQWNTLIKREETERQKRESPDLLDRAVAALFFWQKPIEIDNRQTATFSKIEPNDAEKTKATGATGATGATVPTSATAENESSIADESEQDDAPTKVEAEIIDDEVIDDEVIDNEESTEMMVSNRETRAIGRVAPPQMQLRVPTNPGMLVQNRPGEVFEIKVDDETAVDRARYLQICDNCYTVVLQESAYCTSCGQTLTSELPTRRELLDDTRASAIKSFRYGVVSVLPLLLFILFIVAQFFIGTEPVTIRSMTNLLIRAMMPILFFGIVPSFLLAYRAMNEGQKALIYQDLNATLKKTRGTFAAIGRSLGQFSMYAWGFLILLFFMILNMLDTNVL